MRLLINSIFLMAFLASSSSFADDKCNRESVARLDILNCIATSQAAIDKVLNENYKRIIGKVNDKSLLRDGQRLWVGFRDARCKYMYDSISPGEESEMERQSCITLLTYARVLELIYIESGVSDGGFYRKIVSLGLASRFEGDGDGFREYINTFVSIPEADKYFKSNCRLVGSMYGEAADDCEVRMKIQNI